MTEPITCPSCGSTSWTRVEDGTEHSEDLLDTAAGKAEELEDDHANTESTWKCHGCETDVDNLKLDDVSVDELNEKLDEAFYAADWSEPTQGRPLL